MTPAAMHTTRSFHPTFTFLNSLCKWTVPYNKSRERDNLSSLLMDGYTRCVSLFDCQEDAYIKLYSYQTMEHSR
jgi:hypothetical protein